MKRILFLGIFWFGHIIGAEHHTPLKVLHLSFHDGCINDFAEVAADLGIDLTNWRIAGPEITRSFFDGMSNGNNVYNISHARAASIWQRHKNFFDTFDVIVTSDTAPLSRIFLQHGWKKPLIIWVCNRFDYADIDTQDISFPDREYYDLFAQATTSPNVKIVSYTPYEHHYARRKKIEMGTRLIRPLGTQEQMPGADWQSRIPEWVDQKSTLFLFPRLTNGQIKHIRKECGARGINTYCGVYNGPEDLKGFKGIIYFPYAWSNLALFENLQRGLVHFVPSKKFIINAVRNSEQIRFLPMDTIYDFELCEWYCDDYKDLMVYFDSWDELQRKVVTTDYVELSKKVKAAGKHHRQEMLKKWHELFEEIKETL